MKHCMIDIETLGLIPGGIVLSIGAVVFDPDKNQPNISEFYVNIDSKDSEAAGLIRDPKVDKWWRNQSKEARDALKVNRQPLNASMAAFLSFYNRNKCERIWGHGRCFDPPILQYAMNLSELIEFGAQEDFYPPNHIEQVMKKIGMGRSPWGFWEMRDTRTIFEIANIEVDRNKGVHHNALDDARNQAAAVCRAYEIINKWKENSWKYEELD